MAGVEGIGIVYIEYQHRKDGNVSPQASIFPRHSYGDTCFLILCVRQDQPDAQCGVVELHATKKSDKVR